MTYALLLASSILLSLILTPAARRLALRFGAIDKPDERRIHLLPTPRLGGLAVYGSLLLSLSVMSVVDSSIAGVLSLNLQNFAFAAGGTLVLAVGMIDDCRSLTPVVKLLAEILAAVAVVASGCRINAEFGWEFGWLGAPLSVLWIVAVTNGVNMIDGLDGLAVGASLISSVALFSVALYLAHVNSALILAALCGALFGFLCYNFHPARIFLGDSGSLLVGFVLAVTAIESASKAAAAVAILVPILAMGLPLGELALTTFRRILRTVRVVRVDGQTRRYEFSAFERPALFTADQGHIYHRLLALGITQRTAVIVLYGVCAGLGLAAFAVVIYQGMVLALLLAAVAVMATVAVRGLDYRELQLLRGGVFLPLFDLPAMSRKLVYIAVDIVFIVASWLGASVICYQGEMSDVALWRLLHVVPLITLVQIGCFMVSGFYRRFYRYAGVADLLAIAKALALAAAATWVALLAAGHGQPPALSVTLLDGYLLATLTVGSRLSFRVLEHFFNAGRSGRRRAVIYGAGNCGVAALHEFQSNPTLGIEAVCFLDDDPRKQGGMIQGIPIQGFEALAALLEQRKIDDVIMATAKITQERLETLGRRCTQAGIALRRFQITLDGVQALAKPSLTPVASQHTTASAEKFTGPRGV